MKQILIFYFLSLVYAVHLGITLSSTQRSDVKVFLCLLEQKYNLVIVSVLDDSKDIYNATQNLILANSHKLQTDLFLVYYRQKSPEAQVNLILGSLPAQLYSTVWISTLDGQQDNNPSGNCNYLKRIITAIKSHGKKPGIISSKINWNYYFQDSCKQLGSQPLWYFGNQSLNYSDFQPFGGWTEPSLKRYSSSKGNCTKQSYWDSFYI